MDMFDHQHVGIDGQAIFSRGFLEAPEKVTIIAERGKCCLAIVATLDLLLKCFFEKSRGNRANACSVRR